MPHSFLLLHPKCHHFQHNHCFPCLRSKRSRTSRTKYRASRRSFRIRDARKMGREQKGRGRGVGEGKKGTLARKPLYSEKRLPTFTVDFTQWLTDVKNYFFKTIYSICVSCHTRENLQCRSICNVEGPWDRNSKRTLQNLSVFKVKFGKASLNLVNLVISRQKIFSNHQNELMH